MSETVLKIIPIDQDYVPSPAQQEKALALLRELVPFGMHEARVYDDLTFIDQGEYCEAVLCPSCGGRVAVDPFSGSDLTRDWYSRLSEAIATGAPIRTFKTIMPCCRRAYRSPRSNFTCRPALPASSSVSRTRAPKTSVPT